MRIVARGVLLEFVEFERVQLWDSSHGRRASVGYGNTKATTETHVTFTRATVVVSLATVEHDLVDVSRDGSTFTFSTDSAPLSSLAPGKVMLLEGVDVAKVTGVSHSDGHLVVTTTPATLTDVIKSGTIKVTAAPDFKHGFGVQLGSDASSAVAVEPLRTKASGHPGAMLVGFDSPKPAATPPTPTTSPPTPPGASLSARSAR